MYPVRFSSYMENCSVNDGFNQSTIFNDVFQEGHYLPFLFYGWNPFGTHHSHLRQIIQTHPFVHVSTTGSMCFLALGSTGVVASQTHLDAPQGWLCRRPCRAQFLISKRSLETKQKHFSIIQFSMLWLVCLSHFNMHLAVGHFPKLETGMNPAHKLAGWNVQKVYTDVFKRYPLGTLDLVPCFIVPGNTPCRNVSCSKR